MRNKVLLLITMVSLFFASCSDQLEIKSEASLSANSQLSSSDVDKLLNGLYERMTSPSNYGFFNVMFTEIMGDNYKPVKFQWFQVQNMYEHNIPSDDILLGYNYKDFYTGIMRANTIIKVPSASADQVGKARYCRALNYLRLYDIYESVPLVDETYDNKDIAPSSKQDVMQFIINDLKFAKENCDPLDATDMTTAQTMPSKEAAQALLARVYRLNGQIDLAAAEAEDLITKGKFTLAANPIERTTEVICRFASVKDENAGWGWIMSPTSAYWNNFACADDLVALLDDDDTRRILFDIEGKDDNKGYVYSKKYATDWDSDLLVSRIAEMYLISAEGGNANRLTELQTIRNSSLSLDNERRLEMSFEWTRWEDLKLSGAETYIPPYPQSAVDANSLLSN